VFGVCDGLRINPKGIGSFSNADFGCPPEGVERLDTLAVISRHSSIASAFSILLSGALSADDALKRQGMGTRFRVRETSEWKLHTAELETEMLRRGMMFEAIDWSEDQATLPFEE